MILEGAVCFAVVPNAKANYALKSTSLYPAIVLERLRKEDVKLADGPLNLIEHMDISFLYRKNITRTILVRYARQNTLIIMTYLSLTLYICICIWIHRWTIFDSLICSVNLILVCTTILLSAALYAPYERLVASRDTRLYVFCCCIVSVCAAVCWGVLLYEIVFAVNALTGGTVQDTFNNWRWRVVISTLIRESMKVLI